MELYIFSRGPAEITESVAESDNAVQPDGSEWLMPELLPSPEELPPLELDALPTVKPPPTETVYVPMDPIDKSLTKVEAAAKPSPTQSTSSAISGAIA